MEIAWLALVSLAALPKSSVYKPLVQAKLAPALTHIPQNALLPGDGEFVDTQLSTGSIPRLSMGSIRALLCCCSRRFFLILVQSSTGQLSTSQLLAWDLHSNINCLQMVHWFHFPDSMSLHSLAWVNTLFILMQLGCWQCTSWHSVAWTKTLEASSLGSFWLAISSDGGFSCSNIPKPSFSIGCGWDTSV